MSNRTQARKHLHNNLDGALANILNRNHAPIVAITGSGGGKGGGGGSSSEDPNTLQANTIVSFIDIVSEGPIVGLANGAASIFFDGTALEDAEEEAEIGDNSGNFNFAGVSYDTRLGAPDQDYMPGFSDAEDTEVVNVQVFNATPVTQTLEGPIDAAVVTISLPALTFLDPSTGDLHGSSIQLEMYARSPGGSGSYGDPLATVTVNGKTTSTFQFDVRLELGGTDNWDIKVVRVTADSTMANLQNNTFWATVTSIIDDKFIYPDSAYIGMQVNAQQFGTSIPTRSYDIQGLIIQIPSNYDPIARTYSGMWDGTFTTAWTDNPAWVLYDLLTNSRYGIGSYLTPAQVDKWSLYEIAQYCDGMVDDGYGGLEPRYTFNYQITTADDAYKVLQSIASSFRGITSWASGTVFFVADMPRDPDKLVNQADVIGGIFTYEDTAYSADHSVCTVVWFDPNDQCNQTIELVQDAALVQKLGWRTTALTAYGCTSRGRAHRLGKWVLDNEKFTSETISYDVSFDHLDVMPGMIVEVSDPTYQGIRMGGRISGSSANSVTLDQPFALADGVVYTLRITLADGSIVSRVLTNTPGTYLTVTFADALTTQPVVGGLYIMTSPILGTRLFRIMNIQETAPTTCTITGVLHDPNKYARVEEGIFLSDSPKSILKVVAPLPPRGITTQEYLYRYASAIRSAVTVSWEAPADTSQVMDYELQWQRNGANWNAVPLTGAISTDIQNVDAGTYIFRVRAVGMGGTTSDWFTQSVILFGIDQPPADVVGLSINYLGESIFLQWTANTDLDIDFYHIKFSPVLSGATWESSIDLLPQVFSSSIQIPALIGSFLVKAVSTADVESTNAAVAIPTVASLTGFNAVLAVSDFPSWSGTKTNCAVSGTALEMSLDMSGNVEPTGSYIFASTTDLGAVYTSRLTAAVDADASNIGLPVSSWVTVAAQTTIDGTDTAQWAMQLQLRYTQTDPTMSPTWTDWSNLVVGDYTARAFQFRILLFSFALNVQPVVNDATITIDMPDRTESDNNVSVTSSGITITFDPPFKATPAVGITGQNLSSADRWVYTTLPSATGFAGKWEDLTGTAVARTMDWIADGYGYGS